MTGFRAPDAPRILAGATALDRRAFPRPGSVARWFEPFHIRQPKVARGEIAAQVVAGADIVVAPAWLTHRRALGAVGESRRAREWTMAAVRVSREAIEAGLERREDGQARAVLVAGPLPDVSARPEHATGRRLSASASMERDTHDQAGILADAGVDLVLVERRPSLDAARWATEAAADTGTPTWTTIPMSAAGEPPLAEMVATLVATGAAGVLLDIRDATDAARAQSTLETAMGAERAPMGLIAETPRLAVDADTLDGWVRSGTDVLGITAGADPDALRPLVEARDRVLADRQGRMDAGRAALTAWVRDAAGRAPGGRALWLGTREADRPSGFDWVVIETPEVAGLGLLETAFQLVIDLSGGQIDVLARLVDRGGVIASQAGTPWDRDALAALAGVGLRVLEVSTGPDGQGRLVARREGA